MPEGPCHFTTGKWLGAEVHSRGVLVQGLCPSTGHMTNGGRIVGKNMTLISWAKGNLLDGWGSTSKTKYMFGFCGCENDPYHNKEKGRACTVQLLSFAKRLASVFLETCMRNWFDQWQKEKEGSILPSSNLSPSEDFTCCYSALNWFCQQKKNNQSCLF